MGSDERANNSSASPSPSPSSPPPPLEVSEGRAAARGTLLTLLLRLISFVCTQATLRFLDPTTLGKANIQLELLLTTVLFISREGFRLSLTRNVADDNWDVAWLTIPLVTLVSGSALVWHALMGTDQDFQSAAILYCLASWVEGCAEPAILYFLRDMDVPKRAAAEGYATMVKTAATILILQYADPSWHVTVFGIAQVLYAVTYSSYLYWHAWSKLTWSGTSTTYDMSTIYMTLIFTIQGCFKHLLTEADRIVLTAISDSYNQGVYAMGSAYGGMAARLLLQPLEENARLLWSRLASRNDINALEESYTILVKLVLYVGFIFSCLAVNYTNLLLNLLAGRKWGGNTEAANVLSAFCVYTAFLACNGMTEAFVYGVSSSGKEIGRLGMAHIFTAIIFAVSASSLVSNYGTIGLVGANCVAMLTRSIYSMYFAASYFGRMGSTSSRGSILKLVTTIIPHPIVLFGFVGAWFVTHGTLGQLILEGYHTQINFSDENWIKLTSQHLAAGVTCFIGVSTLAFFMDISFIRSLRSFISPTKN